MVGSVDGRLRKSDLAHGEQPLIPSAVFTLHQATVSMRLHAVRGLEYLLDTLLDRDAAPVTASLVLTPHTYCSQELSPPEFPPSNLLVGVDQEHAVAAVALLAFDQRHHSHQWLPQGNAWHQDVAALVMDPANAEDAVFPREAYITTAQLRAVVADWAWGDQLPPAGVRWRPATEREVRWSWF